MAFTFNPFTGNLDIVNTITAASVGSSPNANGLSISGGSVITLQPANGTNPGVLTSGTQTIGGNKTFNGTISASNLSGTNSGDVTLTTVGSNPNANGASLSGQVLTLQPSNTSFPGVLLAADFNTFNNKQPAGNYITALTGDATASGPGSAALTLATVNSNVGSFTNASITVNAKGLITAASNGTTAVTSISVATANGLAGSSSGGATPALTLSTTITGILQGNGTAISAATTTGSGNVVLATAPTLSNPIVGTQSQGDSSTKAASTSYVDVAIANAIAGVNPAVAVQAATTANLTGYTYLNGVSGIGATLTAGSNNVALTVDGYTFTTLGQRLLAKDQSSGFQNGVYYVTQLQTSILPVILTRALDYDTPSDINNTGAIPVVNGTVNGTTSWVQTAQITTVGTDSLVFVKFSRNPADYLLVANNLSDVASKTTSFNNLSPMTTGGDLIYGGASGTGTRLANGSAGQVLTSAGTTLAPTWQTPTTGTVTAVSVVSANGFAGSSSGGATPALTLTTTITGLLKGNGTAISAASAGTDYVVPVTGDIVPTSFTAANNQSSATNVTGFAFANGTTRAFTAFVSVTVIATSSLYEYITLEGIQRGSDWQMSARSSGDVSGFLFTITTAGQIQYTSISYSGFTSATLKFRAINLSI